MAINVKGVFLMAKEVVPIMLRQKGGVDCEHRECSGAFGDRSAIGIQHIPRDCGPDDEVSGPDYPEEHSE